jgi:predicted nuclease of predicted toxin-antitoxin system
MKFLIDAQLPYCLKLWLVENDFDAIQTDDLPTET